MKAMILAAGLGTRLRPLTDNKSKAMVEVAGHPILLHAINRIYSFGFDQIVVNVHHFGNQIIDFLKNNTPKGVTIYISNEIGELLDTGGGLLNARKYLDGNEPFLLHNVDIYSTINLKDMYDAHIANNYMVSMAVKHRESSNYLLFDEENILCGWYSTKTGAKRIAIEKPTYNEMAFSGVHIISPEIFQYITEAGKFGIVPVYLRLAEKHKLGAYIHDGSDVLDLGKHENLKKAELLMK